MKYTTYDQELLRNDNLYDFYVKAFNKEGFPFHNFSSIILDWELHNNPKAALSPYSPTIKDEIDYLNKCQGCKDELINLGIERFYSGDFKLQV